MAKRPRHGVGGEKLKATGHPEVEEGYLQAGAFYIHYLRALNSAQPAGPPLILLHGLGGSLEWWRPNIGPLSRGRAVYAPDLPGHGLSAKPPIYYTLPLARAFLLDFLEAQGLTTIDLAGHSTGGMIALDFALAHPQRVRRLVLADAAGLGRKVNPWLRLMTLPLLGELLAVPRRTLLRLFLKTLFYDPRLATPELVEQVYRERSHPGFKHALLDIMRHGMGLRGLKPHVVFRDRLPELKAPTLIIWGEQDRILPVSQARAAHRLIPGSRLHILPRCGHCPSLERPGEFNELVADFLG